jgi:hypothetical protein
VKISNICVNIIVMKLAKLDFTTHVKNHGSAACTKSL